MTDNILTPPWQGIGRQLSSDIVNSEEAIKEAGLDWKVEKRPLYIEGLNGEAQEVPNKYAIVRTDKHTPIGVVGKVHQPFQNIEAFNFMDGLVADGSIKYEYGGSTNGGSKIWLLGKVGQSEIIPNDLVNQYLLLLNSHNSSTRIKVLFTTIRAVCYNMVTLAINKQIGEELAVKHTQNAAIRLEEGKQILGLAQEKFLTYNNFIEYVSKLQFNTQRLEDFTKAVFPPPKDIEKFKATETRRIKQREEIVNLFESGIGQDIPGVKGTGWAAYNAVSEYITHHRPMRNRGEDNKGKKFAGVAFSSSPLIKNATRFLLAA